MTSTLPKWLRGIWVVLAPLGLAFALRIAWEKTFLTWAEGPQMIGFSLMHIHPVFFLVGVLSCYGLVLWLVPATIFAIKDRKRISKSDVVMAVVCLFVLAVMIVPDSAFA